MNAQMMMMMTSCWPLAPSGVGNVVPAGDTRPGLPAQSTFESGREIRKFVAASTNGDCTIGPREDRNAGARRRRAEKREAERQAQLDALWGPLR